MEELKYITEIAGSHSVITWLVIIIIALSCFIEIIPVKVNPLSAILKYIGNCMFSDINERLEKIETQMDENEIDHIRWEILNFANACRDGQRKPSQDEFEHVISQNSKYKNLIEKHDIANDVYTEEYNFILELYHKYQYEKLNSNG